MMKKQTFDAEKELFDLPPSGEEDEKKHATSMQKQRRGILVALAASLALAVGLFVAYQTVWKAGPAEEKETEYVNNSAGTVNTALAMDEIAEISVKNRDHAWRLYRGSDGELYFEGATRVLYNSNRIAYLRSCVTNLAASVKVEEPRSMEEYGLTEELCLCEFTVKSTAGESYRILVGEKLVGGEGYYARVAEDPQVWVLPTSLENCLFGDINFFLLGQVAPSLSENNYFEISEFVLEKNLKKGEDGAYSGEVVVEVERIPEEELKENDISTHRIVAPIPDAPNTDLLSLVFKSFVSFVGDTVAEYDMSQKSVEEYTEIMRKYGFLTEAEDGMRCRVRYTHSGIETELYVSAADEEGNRYVYSPGFEIIARFDAADLVWCDYTLMEYSQPELFLRSISEIRSIAVTAPGISTVFTLSHGQTAAELSVNTENGAVNAQDFRQFYNQLLYLEKVEQYAPEEGFESTKSLTLVVTDTQGGVQTFTFYDVKSLRSYYQVDGVGEFCVKRDYTKKLVEDVARLLAGESVTAVQYP